jgi:hypothetical protein
MACLKLNFSLLLHFKRMRTEELKKEKGTEYILSPPLYAVGTE